MHDVVRQMALWIASGFGKEKENFVVKSGAGLRQMPEVRHWNAVRRMSLQNNKIENISVTPDCSNLMTLILVENKLENISGEFFLSMPKLLVLDLSYNEHLSKLPEEVSNLVSLRYLGLAGTKLKNLPEGLRKLIQLRHLDLRGVETLSSISVISSLVNMETLDLLDSTPLTLELIEDIKSLEHLKFLRVNINELVVLEHLLSIPRLARCIDGFSLKGIEEINLSFAAALASLRIICIERCSIIDIMEDTRNGCRSPRAIHFQNLGFVRLANVSGIQDLTWLLFAPSLKYLFVIGPSLELQEILSREKVSGIMNEEGSSMTPFANLRVLRLIGLVELKSIYLDFPNLTEVHIHQCPNLKKLPLNTESANRNDFRLCVDTKEWLDRVEWEDDVIKDRFSRLAKFMDY